MTLSLNPNLTQDNKKQNQTEIANQENVIQHKPIDNNDQDSTDNQNTNNQESNQDLTAQNNQNIQDNQDLQNTRNNQDNPLLQDKEYLDFVEKTYHARKSHERLQENPYLRQLSAGAKGLAKNFNEGEFVTIVGDIKNWIDEAQKEEDSIKHDDCVID